MKNRRILVAAALGLVGFVAAVGLRDQFGKGGEFSQQTIESIGYRRGQEVGREHARAGFRSPDVPALAKRSFDGVTTGPKRDWWEAGFVRGYEETARK